MVKQLVYIRGDADPLRPLEELVLKRHVVLWLKTNAGAEDVGESGTLLGKGVDDWGARRCQRSLYKSVNVSIQEAPT